MPYEWVKVRDLENYKRMLSMGMIEVVGSLNMDLVSNTARVPGPGETVRASSFATGFGGKGANQAVAAVRLLPQEFRASGRCVRMIGCLGGDQYGQNFQRHLKQEGIDSSSLTVMPNESTGTAVIIVEENGGENRILFTPGANWQMGPDHVVLQPSQPPSFVIFQLEVPLLTVVQGLRQAKMMQKETILNPAPARELPEDIYRCVDHLILNETEAAMLSQTPENDLILKLESVTGTFIQRGVHNVIITLGSRGLYWRSDIHVQSGARGEQIGARQVNVVDTTAAGDTFVGAFAAYFIGYHHSRDINNTRKAITYANIAASLCVQRKGAQASIPLANQLPSESQPNQATIFSK